MLRIRILIVLVGFVFCSCGGLGVGKAKRKELKGSFAGNFDSEAYDVDGKIYGSPTLLELFEIQHVTVSSVRVEINEDGLQLTYNENGVAGVKRFVGTYSDHGHYEIFLHHEKLEIPPLIPVIYSRSDVNRIRVGLTPAGDLIIDNMWDQGGNIFLLGSGDKGRRQSFFKKR